SKDTSFATKAAQGGLAEVSIGQSAQENGSDPKIKEFGQRMVTDHSKANDELKQIAQQENRTLPSEPSGDEKKSADDLKKLHGAQFDEAYASMMVKDHEQDVALFKKEAQSGEDPQL